MQYTIDAKNKKLGRIATEIATILQGKKSPFYEQRLAGSDSVVVENIKELAFTGSKLEKKQYHHHTGYMGHLKSRTLKDVFAEDPKKILRHTVERMLPKNFLLAKRMQRLTIKD
ncbi:MAG: 50S ribosomal protein L13 [bacterium]|nr:50S ribosomal protein L13 [bacterium]